MGGFFQNILTKTELSWEVIQINGHIWEDDMNREAAHKYSFKNKYKFVVGVTADKESVNLLHQQAGGNTVSLFSPHWEALRKLDDFQWDYVFCKGEEHSDRLTPAWFQKQWLQQHSEFSLV